MSKREPSSCFDAFSPFLQEITNIIGGFGVDPENKENIPPGILGHVLDEPCGPKGNGIAQQQEQQQYNALAVNGFCTPVMIRQRPKHTGLTPGNKSAPETWSSGTSCVNTVDASLPTVHETKDILFLSSPAKGGTPVHQQTNLCELFQGCVPLLQPHQSLNVSVESTFLSKGLLMESDDDDTRRGLQMTKRPRLHDLEKEGWTTPPLQKLVPSSLLLQESESKSQKQKLKGKHLFSAVSESFSPPQPMLPNGVQRHKTLPPEYPRNDSQNKVTRVFRRAAPLIAVGGRRVPIDKLHLLLRPLSVESGSGVDNGSGSMGLTTTPDRVAADPLVPSARPTPTAVKTIKVMSSPSVVPVPSFRRYPPQYHQHHHEVVVLEFARGVSMRFSSDPTLISCVMGKRYLAAIRSSRSPYDNVAYKDVGVCVHIMRQYADTNCGAVVGGMDKGILDGCIVRVVDENSQAEVARMRSSMEARESAILECQKHFRFLNLPFELVDVQYTFDRSICVVYYSINPQDGTSSQPNVSRLIRMLQHRLNCKVYLKTDSCSQ